MEEQSARLRELRRLVASVRNISQNTSDLSEDAQCLQEELRLVLGREKEAQRELSVLRSLLAKTQEQTQPTQVNHKVRTSTVHIRVGKRVLNNSFKIVSKSVLCNSDNTSEYKYH